MKCNHHDCPREVEPGFRGCTYHLRIHRAGSKRHVRAKEENGFCRWGGCYAVVRTHKYCPEHRKYFRDKSRARRKKEKASDVHVNGGCHE